MRATLALDDDLVRIAQEFTGIAEKTALVREALKALIERESARRLAALGGTMTESKDIPRRRPGNNSGVIRRVVAKGSDLGQSYENE